MINEDTDLYEDERMVNCLYCKHRVTDHLAWPSQEEIEAGSAYWHADGFMCLVLDCDCQEFV